MKNKIISRNLWIFARKKNKSLQAQKSQFLLFLIPAIFFIIDRVFKNVALKNITTSNFLFDFHYVQNTGISWGVFDGNSSLFLWISIIIVGVLVYFYNELKNAKLGTNLVLIGAVSNILDRILFGHVIDYINFRFFPVFNIADACIVLGGIYIILWYLFFEKKKN